MWGWLVQNDAEVTVKGGLPRTPSKCAGWYFRAYALVWERGGHCLHCLSKATGEKVFLESETLVPLLTRAAPGPWRPSQAGASDASHSLIPMIVKFGG